MENRSGLLVDACLTPADGHAERIAALAMIEPQADRPRAITLGADKAYDTEDFVNELRAMKVTPHVAQSTNGRRSAIDGRTIRHAGYAISQRIRKRIEEAVGWPAEDNVPWADGPSHSPPRPTISSDCPSSWRRPDDDPRAPAITSQCRIVEIHVRDNNRHQPDAVDQPNLLVQQPASPQSSETWLMGLPVGVCSTLFP